MRRGESELEMVRRHVSRGRKLIERQRQLIADKEEKGQPTGLARDTLDQLGTTQRMHEQHLEQIE